MTIKCTKLLDNDGSSSKNDVYCDELATVFYTSAYAVFGRCDHHKIPLGIYSKYNFKSHDAAMLELVKRGL